MSLPNTLRLSASRLTSSITVHAVPKIRPFSSSSSSPILRRALPGQPSPVQHNFRRGYSSGQNPTPGKSPFKVWPFVLITLLGSGTYAMMVRRRSEPLQAIEAPEEKARLPAPSKSTPTFSPPGVSVIFVLGGPGAGKGTQCANLVRDYGFVHLSAGDLLRAEQERPGSEFGQLIKDYIRDGKIVPMEVTVQLLENAMTEALNKGVAKHGGQGKFLIDGFPRKMDQALYFEENVCPSLFTLFFDCPESELERRLLNRGLTSGRADDNLESIKKRFRTFIETSMPVVNYFAKEGKVEKIDATKGPDQVYDVVKKVMAKRGVAMEKAS